MRSSNIASLTSASILRAGARYAGVRGNVDRCCVIALDAPILLMATRASELARARRVTRKEEFPRPWAEIRAAYRANVGRMRVVCLDQQRHKECDENQR